MMFRLIVLIFSLSIIFSFAPNVLAQETIEVNDVPVGAIILWGQSSCPTGYTRLDSLAGRYIRATTTTAFFTGGSSTHNHSYQFNSFSTADSTGQQFVGYIGAQTNLRAYPGGGADSINWFNHSVGTASASNDPLYVDFVLCLKSAVYEVEITALQTEEISETLGLMLEELEQFHQDCLDGRCRNLPGDVITYTAAATSTGDLTTFYLARNTTLGDWVIAAGLMILIFLNAGAIIFNAMRGGRL